MNPGIFYLYEYKNHQKHRNVGFLKLIRHYNTCTLQLHARGIPVTRQDTLKLYAFYMENETARSGMIAEIPCNNQSVSAKLNIAETAFPNQHTLNDIHGFFLPISDDRILAVTIPGITLDTRQIKYPAALEAESLNLCPLPQTEPSSRTEQLPQTEQSPQAEQPSQAEQPPQTEQPPRTEQPPQAEQPPRVEQPPQAEQLPLAEQPPRTEQPSQVEQPSQTEQPPRTEQPSQVEQLPQTEQQSRAETVAQEEPAAQSQKCIRKIQRSEMSVLPRRYWNLANNSFLLHGYNNYNHLLLVEEDGHYWLGIPGIYDTREARAAELFGFPQFTNSYNDKMSLTEEECSSHGDFGYWCRFLR